MKDMIFCMQDMVRIEERGPNYPVVILNYLIRSFVKIMQFYIDCQES